MTRLIRFLKLCGWIAWESLFHPGCTSYIEFDDAGRVTVRREPG